MKEAHCVYLVRMMTTKWRLQEIPQSDICKLSKDCIEIKNRLLSLAPVAMNIKGKIILLLSLFTITLLFSACSSKKKCNTKGKKKVEMGWM